MAPLKAERPQARTGANTGANTGGIRRDPAPSRLAYRWQRLRLTPRFQKTLKTSIWALPLIGAIGFAVSHKPTNTRLIQAWDDTRAAFEERPEFSLKVLRIQGADGALAAELRETLAFDFPVSSFDVDLAAKRELIEELAAVESAKLSIHKDNVLLVEVVPRTPVAVIKQPESTDVFDLAGVRVAQAVERPDYPKLPFLAGEGAVEAIPEALALFDVARPLGTDLIGFERVGKRRWDIVLRSGQRILLPASNPERALERVLFLNNAQELLARDVLVVDMRLGRRPTLRLGADALRSLQLSGYSEDEE
ncbi:MAG: cell division protein FtsQ/DivIB [Pseudomonadota bacterium]